LTIRLVKGAYWDQETIKAVQKHWPQPVYNDKATTDANFEAIIQILLENHEYVYSTIGSHNVRSQSRAIAIAEILQFPRLCLELQVLYGMGDRIAKALVDKGYRVRVYCPYGDLLPGMAYLIRRLLENTANSSFLRQNLENRPVEELLAPPIPSSPSLPGGTKGGFIGIADTDFSEEKKRNKSSLAFAGVRQQLGKIYLPFVNGEYVNTITFIDSLNPSNFSEVVGKIGLLSVEQAEQAMQAAKAAFPAWKKTPVKERGDILRKAADLMEQ
jgi:RHH-type proline utilization regulon transcriptional repressor/proline dehydrogenase/delta 1-pyrroline-5-carboxylate dehydrogenase